MPLNTRKAQQIAARMLTDYDAHRPNQIFAERGTDWLTLDDAYILQRAVAELRMARGERCIGYKMGCLSPTIQKQLGLQQPVRGYLWRKEMVASGSHILYDSNRNCRESRFVSLAIEGEIALRLCQDISPEVALDANVSDCVDCWFPVIELHNAVFRGSTPTSQELIAGNAMHAGFVVPSFPESSSLTGLGHSEIRVEINGEIVESKRVAEIPGGPLGSVYRLASMALPIKEPLKAGDIVLTGSPGRLIPIEGSCAIAVICEGERVDLSVQESSNDKVA